MKKVLSVSFFMIACGMPFERATAQTSIVTSPATTIKLPVGHSGTITSQASIDAVPSNVSRGMRRWETFLNQSYPNQFNGPRKLGALILELQQQGLPILLGQSAIDDGLGPEVSIELRLSNAPLYTRFKAALRELNAYLDIRTDSILINSLDDYGEYDSMTTIVYDISGLGVNTHSLMATIQNTVAPDEWEDTGTGLGTLQVLSMRNRDFLIIGQTYKNQLEIRRLLGSMTRMAGGQLTRNFQRNELRTNQPTASNGRSYSVAVPHENVSPRIKIWSQSENRLPGKGSRNSGGVFSIGNR